MYVPGKAVCVSQWALGDLKDTRGLLGGGWLRIGKGYLEKYSPVRI